MIDLDTTTKKFLHVSEVSELLGVTSRTVYNWVQSGDLPSAHVGGSCRIPVSAIRQLIPHDPPSSSLLSRFVKSAKTA